MHRRISRLAAPFALVAWPLLLAGCGAPPSGASSTDEPTATTQQATTVCGQTSVKGVDISHYDGTIDWPTVKKAGIAFAFAKATESTNFVDPTFATNWAGMKSAGVVRGAYHFFHADVDPVAQAQFVVKTVGTLDPDDLPIVLDLETTNGQTDATVLANATTFLDTVTQLTGRTAIVYTSPSFLPDFSSLAPYGLWVANWGVSCPDVPSPWSTWAFWQDSSTGTVSGIPSTAVDLDDFNGTLAQLLGNGSGGDAGTGSSGGGDAGTKDGGSSGGSSSGSSGGGSSSGSSGGGGSSGGSGSSGGGSGGGSGALPDGGTGSGGASDGGPAAWDSPMGSSGHGGGCSVASVGADGSTSAVFSLSALLALAAVRRRRRSDGRA